MKTEIETRFLGIDKNSLISRLKSLGAVDNGEAKLNDTIFYDKDLTWLGQHKLIKVREKNGKAKLSFKSNKEQTVDSTKEIEFDVSDAEEAKIFLESVGFVIFRTVEKRRHSFSLDNVSVDVDTWPEIPIFVELEGSSVEELKLIAQKLELDWEQIFCCDPKFGYKEYGFDFGKIRTINYAQVG